MVNLSTDTSVYVVLQLRPGYITAYAHRKKGIGRAARRELLIAVHVPEPVSGDLTTVLEAVAAEMRLPPLARWQPPLPGLGGPRGGGGGSEG